MILPTETETGAFAAQAHAGQLDAAGQPYIRHLWEVAWRVAQLLAFAGHKAPAAKEQAAIRRASLLHDVLEDTPVTAAELEARFGARITQLVQAVTRPEGSVYQAWIEGIVASGDVGAMLIKLGDNRHNASPARVKALPPERRGLVTRYARSIETLTAGLQERGVKVPSEPSYVPRSGRLNLRRKTVTERRAK